MPSASQFASRLKRSWSIFENGISFLKNGPLQLFYFPFSLQFEDLVSINGTKFGDSVKSKMALGTGSNEKQIFNFIRRHFAFRQLNSEMS
jgi:hypothetical protein